MQQESFRELLEQIERGEYDSFLARNGRSKRTDLTCPAAPVAAAASAVRHARATRPPRQWKALFARSQLAAHRGRGPT